MAGQRCKVVSSATEDELKELVAKVDARVDEVKGAGRGPAQALALVAISLAHELEEERARRRALERRARDLVRRVVVRIDQARDDEGARAH